MGTREQDIDRWLARALDGRRFLRVPASDDASFRRYFRIRCDSDAARILMDAPPAQEDCAPFVDIAKRLHRAGVNVPEVLAADLQQGFLLLTDLGTVQYLDQLTAARADALYQDALRALLKMQSNADAQGLPHYDRTQLDDEMSLFDDWFLRRHLGVNLSQNQTARLRSAKDTLLDACLEQPQVFVHRDFHSRNLMLTAKHNPGVLDFQDALLGPVSYDLVSLLRDVYVEWPQADVARWAQDYLTLAQHAGVLPVTTSDTWQRWFDFTGVQRHLKVAGIFARLNYRDGKPRYLADLPLTLRYLSQVCAQHSALADLGRLLSELDVHAASASAVARCGPPTGDANAQRNSAR